ncbi:hypothetical protein [Cupriavidus necator]
MLNDAQKALVERSIEEAKREIQEDIASGRVPFTVTTFPELHDYVDANCYGGLCDDGGEWDTVFAGRWAEANDPNGSEIFCDAANQLQDALDLWLKGMDRCNLLVERMCEDALDAACYSIQERVGEDAGDLASVMFSGSGKDAFVAAIEDYVWAEIRAKCDEAAAK